MRKSLIMMVVMLSAFSVEKASAFLSQNSCCCFTGVREKSFELNVGYRRDYLHWKFKDPSVNFFQVLVPVVVNRIAILAGELDPSGNGGMAFSMTPDTPSRFIQTEDIPGLVSGFIEKVLCENDTYRNKWKNLRMINVGGSARAVTCEDFYGRISGNYAYIVDGKFKPSGIIAGGRDFFDDILSECGLGPCPCKRVCGHTWDVSGALGYQICACDGDMKIAPLIGFAYHDIDMRTDTQKTEGTNEPIFSDLVSFIDPSILDLTVTDNSLEAKSKNDFCSHWTGPFIGFDAVYQCGCQSNLYLNFEYHWASYHAHSRIKHDVEIFVEAETEFSGMSGPMFADIITFDLESEHCAKFKHHACARGLFLTLGGDYNFCDCLWGGLKFSWMDWKTFKHGRIRSDVENEIDIDLSVEVDGLPGSAEFTDSVTFGSEFCKDARLKTVHWNSFKIEVTLGYSF